MANARHDTRERKDKKWKGKRRKEERNKDRKSNIKWKQNEKTSDKI